jgi:hypothetical protein
MPDGRSLRRSNRLRKGLTMPENSAPEVVLTLDAEAAGYLLDLLYGQIAGAATLKHEPLGRALLALQKAREATPFDRQYLVYLTSAVSPWPCFARDDDTETRALDEDAETWVRYEDFGYQG